MLINEPIKMMAMAFFSSRFYHEVDELCTSAEFIHYTLYEGQQKFLVK